MHFWIVWKAQIVRRENEKDALLEIIDQSAEIDQNDDFSWYFNRSVDDPLDRLEDYENSVQQENLHIFNFISYGTNQNFDFLYFINFLRKLMIIWKTKMQILLFGQVVKAYQIWLKLYNGILESVRMIWLQHFLVSR